jgi:aminopeptidase N
MKKNIVIALSFMLTSIISAQEPVKDFSESREEYRNIVKAFKNTDYLFAVEGITRLIGDYPRSGHLFFMRGLARNGLNDTWGARKDYITAKLLGVNNGIIDFSLSAKSLPMYLSESLLYDVPLDSLRDYRPVIMPADTTRGALRPERTCFDVYFYNLTVRVFPESRTISGSNRIYFTTVSDTRVIQIDLFPRYNIISITRNGKPLGYTRIHGGVFIDLGERLPASARADILVEYEGSPIEAPMAPWNGGFVWGRVKDRYNVGVACEHLGASSWWPNKDHLSDKPDSMIINIQVPGGYQAISNGNLVSRTDAGEGYTNFEWRVSYPINNYNVTFYMGDFVNFHDIVRNGHGEYRVDYYVHQRNLSRARKYYARTREIFEVFERLFGEYPFPIDGAAMVEAPFEGMEHQGAIAIGGGYGKSNNQRDYYTKQFDYLVVHEIAHEWWGNAVAVGDMADAWINEGFATYSEYLFAEEKFGYPEYVKIAASNQGSILNIWPIVGERDINSNTFLGGDIYNKGAAMLNNLRCIFNNDSLFREMIRDFYQEYKYKIITSDDFVNHVKKYAGMNLDSFFRIFLHESEPPVLSCSYNISGNNLTFKYRFSNVGNDFTMPVCIVINDTGYIRLDASAETRTFARENVKSFYLANENRYDKNKMPRDAFTYYWTSWP